MFSLAFLLVFVLFSISRLAEKFRIENHLQGLKLSRLLITNKFDKQGMVGQINNFMVNTISLYTSVCLYTQFFCSFGLFHLPPFMCISFTPLHLFFPLVWPPPSSCAFGLTPPVCVLRFVTLHSPPLFFNLIDWFWFMVAKTYDFMRTKWEHAFNEEIHRLKIAKLSFSFNLNFGLG